MMRAMSEKFEEALNRAVALDAAHFRGFLFGYFVLQISIGLQIRSIYQSLEVGPPVYEYLIWKDIVPFIIGLIYNYCMEPRHFRGRLQQDFMMRVIIRSYLDAFYRSNMFLLLLRSSLNVFMVPPYDEIAYFPFYILILLSKIFTQISFTGIFEWLMSLRDWLGQLGTEEEEDDEFQRERGIIIVDKNNNSVVLVFP